MIKNHVRKKSILFIYAATILIFIYGCGNSKNDDVQIKDGSATLSETGGIVEVKSPDSPIYGAKVVIEDETLLEPETISLDYDSKLPAAFDAAATVSGAKQISPTLVLERSGTIDFGKTVNVTLPYDKSKLPDSATPIIVYWDTLTNSYSPIAIRSIDKQKGTITFLTAHASKYVAIILDSLSKTQEPDYYKFTVNVGFKPAEDSFFIHNFGSYDSPGGNCFAMAAYSAWYQFSKKKVKGKGLWDLYREGDVNKEEDDQISRELIARVFQACSHNICPAIPENQTAHIQALNDVNNSGLIKEINERNVALSLISHLQFTHQAQILALGMTNLMGNITIGHAVTVYAFDGNTKSFLYYDNNYPGEELSIPWDWNSGFGTNSKGKTYDIVAFAAFNNAYSSKTLEDFYNAAEAGFPESHFPKMTITDPVECKEQPNLYEVQKEDNISIKGIVPRSQNSKNPNAQRYVHVYMNGVQINSVFLVSQTNNTFEINLPKLSNPTGTDIMLFVSETKKPWGGVDGRYGLHSFKQFKVRVKDQIFFKNFGFETGNFTGWISERHLWDGSQHVSPSDKSDVLKSNVSGFDPIATDLVVPLFGNCAARINNSDNNYHISTLTQSAIVPKSKNQTLKFYWAAVLEDPQHNPNEQPYVSITLTNKTKGITIYNKMYYSNDPKYSGWRSYRNGQWKSIPWQLAEIPVSTYIGDELVLFVEAADCSLGGHGGYVYIDAEE